MTNASYTVEQYLDILRRDPEFKKIVQESDLANWHFRPRANKQGGFRSPANKAIEICRTGLIKARMNIRLEQTYGVNPYGSREVAKFKDALCLWLAEIWGQLSDA